MITSHNCKTRAIQTKRNSLAVILIALFRGVCADSSDQTLSPIVVTATRSAQSAFEVPAAIDAVSIGDKNTPGINPSEYLDGIPGLIARDRQNYAQDEQISIRGFGARSSFGVRGVRLYTDGIPATMPDGQGQVSNFSLDSAERIEVLRGPFSALYGNSSGGVVQIFTADGADPQQAQMRVAAGDYGTYRIGAGVRGAGGALGYNVDLSQFYTDGYRGHARAQRENGNAKLDFHFDGERKLTLIANTVAVPNADDALGLTRAQLETAPRQPQPVAVQFDTRKSIRQQQLGAIYEQSLCANQSFRVLGYSGQRDVEQFQAIPLTIQARPTSPGGVIDLDGSYGGLDARWIWHGLLGERALEVTAGTSYDRQNVHRFGYNNFAGSQLGVQGDLRRDEQDDVYNFDQYLQANWDLAERWVLNAGVRRSNVRFSVGDHYITAASADDSSRAAYGATTPVAGLLFRATARWHLYADYGNAFETPTFNELSYRPDGSAGINFDLVPARSRNGEIGSKWQFDGGGEFNFALFQSNTRHELAVFTSSGGRTTYQNIDRTRRRGAEGKLELPLNEAWHFDAAYTHLDASVRADFGVPCPPPTQCVADVPAGTRIPGVPKNFATATLRYAVGNGWNATLEGNAASNTPTSDVNTESAPGYGLLGASVGYSFQRGNAKISTFLRLNNLFDRNYAGSVIVNESNGRYYEPAPGRNVFIGCAIDWKR